MPGHLFCSMKLLLSHANFNCTLTYASIACCSHLPAPADTSNFAGRALAAGDAGKRPERMATVTPLDDRVTYGCVNVPADFYDRWVMPTLGKTLGVISVLPENQPVKEHFSFLQ